MPRGISPETIFAKNRPEARPNEMRSAAVSVTYKPNACLPHVARCSPLSRYAKYSQCNTIATAPKVRASDTMAAITAGLHCPSQWCVIFSAVAASPVRKSSGITSANIPTLKIRPSIRWATKRNQNPAYVTLRVVLNPATPTFAGTRSPAAPASAPRTTGLPHDAQNTPSGVRTAPHLEQYTVILLDPRLLRLLAASSRTRAKIRSLQNYSQPSPHQFVQMLLCFAASCPRGSGQQNPRLVAVGAGEGVRLVICARSGTRQAAGIKTKNRTALRRGAMVLTPEGHFILTSASHRLQPGRWRKCPCARDAAGEGIDRSCRQCSRTPRCAARLSATFLRGVRASYPAAAGRKRKVPPGTEWSDCNPR